MKTLVVVREGHFREIRENVLKKFIEGGWSISSHEEWNEAKRQAEAVQRALDEEYERIVDYHWWSDKGNW